MDQEQKNDLSAFLTNLELIAQVLDLSSHKVRHAFGRSPVFQVHPDLQNKLLDVFDTLNHLMESCREIKKNAE